MDTQKRYSPEFRERAVRLVDEQVKSGETQWAAMQSISTRESPGTPPYVATVVRTGGLLPKRPR